MVFFVYEFNGFIFIINEIDKILESMFSYRKNKWIVEGWFWRLKIVLVK